MLVFFFLKPKRAFIGSNRSSVKRRTFISFFPLMFVVQSR